MFMFTAPGSSTGRQGRPTQESAKAKYVPSRLIAQKVAEQEEERRRKDPNYKPEPLHWVSQTEFAPHARTANEVLAPGFISGPLGYEESWQRAPIVLPPLPSDTNATAPRLHTDFSNTNLRSTTAADTQLPFQGATSSAGSTGILKNDRPELGSDEIQRRNASVRFSTLPSELNIARPTTPAIYTQGGPSPFFSSGHPSTNSNSVNLQSALKDNSVDVLKHKSVGTTPSLNSSLGPAVGSVTGAGQGTQTFNNTSNTALRSTGISGVGAGQSSVTGTRSGPVPSFYLSLDRTRQPNVSNVYDSRDDDDEDKDKDRYMPSVLLNSATTMKPIKLEPLVDGPRGKTAWDSEPFQSTEPMREAAPRLPQHLIGEDAPPIDTLYDIALKEKLYSRPLTEVSVSNQDRSDVDMGRLGESNSASTASRNDESYESIITYGFPEELASAMVQEFKFFGEIARFETGYYGRAGAESFNWLKIKFRNASAARRAVSRHLKPVGGFVVGVHPCPSFSDWMSHRMSAATEGGQSLGLAQSVAKDLTESEARDVLSGVDALLRLRAQGGARGADLPIPPQDQARTQSQVEQLRRFAPHLTLLADTDQGMVMIGENLAEAHRLLPSSLNPMAVTATLNAAPIGFGFGGHMPTSSAMEEDGDEEMALILGHSLTSGGSIARTQEKNEIRRSRQRAQQQQEEAKSRPNPDRGILAEPTQEEMMARSAFQRPIHPSVFASSLRPNLESSSSGSQRYTLSRPSFAASNSDDNSLFSASAGVLMETSDSASAAGNGSSDTSMAAFNHVQKRQRLETGSAPRLALTSIHGYGEDGVPLSLFGTGRDRVAALTKANDGAAQEANSSMISSLITMAKKRLFWG